MAKDMDSWRIEELEPLLQFIAYILRYSLTLVNSKDAEWTLSHWGFYLIITILRHKVVQEEAGHPHV